MQIQRYDILTWKVFGLDSDFYISFPRLMFCYCWTFKVNTWFKCSFTCFWERGNWYTYFSWFSGYIALNSHIYEENSSQWKQNPRFGECFTCFGCETKTGVVRIFKIGICSAISFKRSRRELSIDVTEHRSTLKNYQNTHYPRFSVIPTDIASPKTGDCFRCVHLIYISYWHMSILKTDQSTAHTPFLTS